jgi:hypothetical protein
VWVLIGVGSALGLAGLAMGAAALATAGRRWYSRADLSPGELARLKWEQAKAAAGASSGAWTGLLRGPRAVGMCGHAQHVQVALADLEGELGA